MKKRIKKKRGRVTKTLSLDLTLILFRYFLRTEYLHLGYWPEDLPVEIGNLARAQQNYADLVMRYIPEGTRRILEVGCGSGRFALDLVERGYEVECVSPACYLTEYAARRLAGICPVHISGFESFESTGSYDLVMFSESFQYIPLDSALDKALGFLPAGGYLLICDFFRTDVKEKIHIRGGHRIESFLEAVAARPLQKIEEIDITRETAPTLQIVNDVAENLGRPLWELFLYYLEHNSRRFLSKVIRRVLRKRIDRINGMCAHPPQGGFAEQQVYRLYLYRKTSCG